MTLARLIPALLTVLVATISFADADEPKADMSAEVKCVPVAQRGDEELGCYILANKELGSRADKPLYWHLYVYQTRVAADAAKGNVGTVVESFGKVWLLAVADASWGPPGGQRLSRVGPLPIGHGGSYTAEYMEATFLPGMKSRAHRHPGPEAWYVVAGDQCLEIPGKKIELHAGEGGFVPEGPPMVLLGTGTHKRQALALILHDSSSPMTVPAADWTPTGLCTVK